MKRQEIMYEQNEILLYYRKLLQKNIELLYILYHYLYIIINIAKSSKKHNKQISKKK